MSKNLSLTASLAAVLFCSAGLAQENPRSQPPKDQPTRTDQPEKLDKTRDREKPTRTAEPGGEHRNFEALVGAWEINGQCWETPNKPDSVTGTCNSEWVLGNRFVKSHVRGSKAGKNFEGMGVCGYDSGQRKYVSSWIEDMSTAIMTETGSYDSSTRTFTFTSEAKDENGQTVRCRRTVKVNSNDEHVMTAYKADSSGQETKMAEMTFRRTAAKAEVPNRGN